MCLYFSDVGVIGGLQRKPSPNLPLAKIIPVVNGQVHHILFDSDSSYFQDLFKVSSARDFTANVYIRHSVLKWTRDCVFHHWKFDNTVGNHYIPSV